MLNAPKPTGNPLLVTDSVISIAQLLDLARANFPDVLPEDVLRHYGYTERPVGKLGESELYSLRGVREHDRAALDVQVPENMLKKDGLSGDDGMTMTM